MISQTSYQNTLLLISKPPHHPLAQHALTYAKTFLHDNQNEQASLSIFFYADGATHANRLAWQSADQPNLTHDWQQLAEVYGIDLPVCVSTALARGITDEQNAQRHELGSENISSEFSLVGLSELVMAMNNSKVIQF